MSSWEAARCRVYLQIRQDITLWRNLWGSFYMTSMDFAFASDELEPILKLGFGRGWFTALMRLDLILRKFQVAWLFVAQSLMRISSSCKTIALEFSRFNVPIFSSFNISLNWSFNMYLEKGESQNELLYNRYTSLLTTVGINYKIAFLHFLLYVLK